MVELRDRAKLSEGDLLRKNKEIDSLQRELRHLKGDVAGFTRSKHVDYVLNFWRKEKENKDSFEILAMEHIRVQGIFWALGSLEILESNDQMPLVEVVNDVLKSYHPETGGFGGNVGHDTNLINTQFAVYVLSQCRALDRIDKDKVAQYVKGRQQSNGSFADEWSGEHDTRYSACALFCLSVIERLDVVDLDSAVNYVLQCRNMGDGGFGQTPNCESHAAFTYTALAALTVAGYSLPADQADDLAWWLCERQCDSGGLNGRPEKQADVCYSFWALTCLKMLNRVDWIDCERLTSFILQCQDEDGGIADRPGNVSDLFHTFFGLCGLALMHQIDTSAQISPIYALPQRCLPFLHI